MNRTVTKIVSLWHPRVAGKRLIEKIQCWNVGEKKKSDLITFTVPNSFRVKKKHLSEPGMHSRFYVAYLLQVCMASLATHIDPRIYLTYVLVTRMWHSIWHRLWHSMRYIFWPSAWHIPSGYRRAWLSFFLCKIVFFKLIFLQKWHIKKQKHWKIICVEQWSECTNIASKKYKHIYV